MNITLDLSALMPVLPAVLGLAVAVAVELVTKATAPAALKRAVAAALAVLSGVIPTVTLAPHEGARVYVAAVLSAWVVALTTHAAGLTNWVQDATASFGVGPSDPVPADGSDGMAAGAPSAAQAAAEHQQLPADPIPAAPVAPVVVNPAALTVPDPFGTVSPAAAAPAPVPPALH